MRFSRIDLGDPPLTTPPRALGERPSGARAADRSKSLRLVASVEPVDALPAGVTDELWTIFSRYYADVSRPQMERDLSKKQFIILLRDSGDGSLQGFSTLEVYRRDVDGRPFVAVFSGDTIVEEAYWGQSALQRRFVRFMLAMKLRNPTLPVYWFLISKGYKTYLLLARNFPGHWPSHRHATPPMEQAILDELSRDKFGDAYDAAAGVLRFPTCQGRLKEGIAPIDAGLLDHADIRYFVEKNPGHARGDELCCLGRVDLTFPIYFLGRQLRKSVSGCVRWARKVWAIAGASS
ncbi:hypothetical protein L6R52_34255 [Myxococcota bacterium]|nr:hypothetical protein [Myxococcota bacterium]